MITLYLSSITSIIYQPSFNQQNKFNLSYLLLLMWINLNLHGSKQLPESNYIAFNLETNIFENLRLN
jgi:hypothetical protein